MRCTIFNQALLVSLLFGFQACALPFALSHNLAVEQVFRRAPYSVVAVDGGKDAKGAGSTTVRSPEKSTNAAAAITKTIIETEVTTLPPSTDVVMSTQIIDGPEITQTMVVTVTAPGSESTILADGYSIVDVAAPEAHNPSSRPIASPSSSETTSTSELPAASFTSSSSATPSFSSVDEAYLELAEAQTYPAHATTTSSGIQSTQFLSPTSLAPYGTYIETSTPYATQPARVALDAVPWSTSTTIILSTSTSSSCDDAQRHTIYPTWSNTTSTGVASLKARQTATLLKHHRRPMPKDQD